MYYRGVFFVKLALFYLNDVFHTYSSTRIKLFFLGTLFPPCMAHIELFPLTTSEMLAEEESALHSDNRYQ